MKSAIHDERWWRLSMSYEWWGYMSRAMFGGVIGYRYLKFVTLPDQWVEDVTDAMGAYCAGGEL